MVSIALCSKASTSSCVFLSKCVLSLFRGSPSGLSGSLRNPWNNWIVIPWIPSTRNHLMYFPTIQLRQVHSTLMVFSLTAWMKVHSQLSKFLPLILTTLRPDGRSATLIGTPDNPINQDNLSYSNELFLSDESGLLPELAENSNLISSCQSQGSSSDIFDSGILKARGLIEDTFDTFRGVPQNSNDNPDACPNPTAIGSSSGSKNPGTGSNNNNNQRPPTQQPKGTIPIEIESQEDEDLCPTGADGIKKLPLCCYSKRNLMFGDIQKFVCFRRQ